MTGTLAAITIYHQMVPYIVYRPELQVIMECNMHISLTVYALRDWASCTVATTWGPAVSFIV